MYICMHAPHIVCMLYWAQLMLMLPPCKLKINKKEWVDSHPATKRFDLAQVRCSGIFIQYCITEYAQVHGLGAPQTCITVYSIYHSTGTIS